jgi:hypothetical protein
MIKMPSQHLLEMLQAHGDPLCDRDGVIWFVAYRESEEKRASYSAKDTVQDIVAGELPMAERLDQTIVDIFETWGATEIVSLIHEFYGKA